MTGSRTPLVTLHDGAQLSAFGFDRVSNALEQTVTAVEAAPVAKARD